MNRYVVTAVLLLPIVAACGGGDRPPVDPRKTVGTQPGLCDFVTQRIDSAFSCLKTPNLTETGVYGTKEYPNANDLTTSVFGGQVPASLKIVDKETTWETIRYASTFDMSGGLGLKKIAPWFPDIDLTGKTGWSLEVTYSVEAAQVRTLRDLGNALKATLDGAKSTADATPSTSATQRVAEVRAIIDRFCDPSSPTVLATNSYIAKPVIMVRSSSAEALELGVGWQNMIGANFAVKKNGDGSLSITTTKPVVIAVQTVVAATYLKDEPVCQQRAAEHVRDSAYLLARAFVENYQCAFLPVGSAILNKACPVPDPSAPTSSAPNRPCTTCEVAAPFDPVHCDLTKPSLYLQRLSKVHLDVIKQFCAAFGDEMNRGTDPSRPIPINCLTDASDWFTNHAANTWQDVLLKGGVDGSPAPMQISLIQEVVWAKRTGAERIRIAERFQEILSSYAGMAAAEAAWGAARAQYGATELWPSFGRSTWPEFRAHIFGRALQHFSDPKVGGYSPGCRGRYMAYTDVPGAGAGWSAGEGQCTGRNCLHFAPARGVAGVASAFVAGLD